MFSRQVWQYSAAFRINADTTTLFTQALTVLDYLLHAGSENVVIYFKDNIYIIK